MIRNSTPWPLILAAAFPIAAAAQDYEVTLVRAGVVASGVSDAGVVVGRDPVLLRPYAFVDGQRVPLLDTDGIGQASFVGGIQGDVAVGSCFTGGVAVACFWHGSRTATAMALPAGYVAAGASAIADDGHVGGWAFATPVSRSSPAVWTNGVPSVLPMPQGALQGAVRGVSRLGQAVGFVVELDVAAGHAALWSGQTYQRLPGDDAFGSSSYAVSVNASGTIAGVSYDALHETPTAVMWTNSGRVDLPELAPGSSETAGIIDAGDIVGSSGGHAVL